MAEKGAKKLLQTVRDNYKKCTESDDSNRRLANDDLLFLHQPGSQWQQTILNERGNERPAYEFNKLRITVKRIVNDMRANRPAGKVRAVEDGDKGTADVIEGLIRNIWNVSDGDTVIDYAGEYQVGGGMGAWRVDTEYAEESAFDQDIVLKAIRNPFCLYADPSSKDPLKRDAEYWFLTERISKKSFEAKYGDKAKAIDWEDSEFDEKDLWDDGDSVRICEYWYKEPYKKTVLLLSDGSTVDKAEFQGGVDPNGMPLQVVKERETICHKIYQVICSGAAILEGPNEWAGSQFPFVIVYGEHIWLDGKVSWFGLTRFAKDAQRAYNYSRTAAIEAVALAPQAKFWATPEQASGHTDMWAQAHKKLFPYMLYNKDPQIPGPPQMMSGPAIPVAQVQEMQISSEDIKATTGIFDNSLGQEANETSGRAIVARQKQGEIATFNYMDNMSKGIRRTWEILIDLIPKIYDTEKTVRILGTDGAEDYAKINSKDFSGQPINDLSRGRYDVTVTVGPSFSTRRQEAAEIYTQISQRDPLLMQVAGDLVYKSFDLPYAEDVAERYKAVLPPPIQQMLGQGNELPPEAAAAVAQAQSQAQMIVQEVMGKAQELQQQAQQNEQAKMEVQQGKMEIQKLIADLEIKKKEFDAHITKVLADLTLKEAQSAAGEAQQGAEKDRQDLTAELKEAITEIKQAEAEFMQGILQSMAELMAKQQPVIMPAPARPKITAISRVNGKLVPEYEQTEEPPEAA